MNNKNKYLLFFFIGLFALGAVLFSGAMLMASHRAPTDTQAMEQGPQADVITESMQGLMASPITGDIATPTDIEPAAITVLDENSVIVTTWAELKQVLEGDNTYTQIYFGADITGESGGIAINSNKNNLLISGTPPTGGSYTYYEYNQGRTDYVNAIRVQNAGMQLTAVNLNIVGQNYFGSFAVPDGTAYSGVTLTFNNITYNGPQMVYCRYGSAVFNGLNATINNIPGGPDGNELAEISKVDFYGNNTITKTNNTNSLFWMLGSNRYFRVHEGANVEINVQQSYFMYVDGAVTPVDVTVENGASLDVTSAGGFTYTSAHRINSLVVGENANFRSHQITNTGTYQLYINNNLTVSPGGSFEVSNTGNTAANVFMTSGATVNFDNPERVLLYNPTAGRLLRLDATGTVNATASVVNTWTGTTTMTDSISNTPDYIWNNDDLSPFTITSTYSGGVVNNSTATGLTDVDPNQAPVSATTMSYTSQNMISMGTLPLTIDDIYPGAGTVNGTTSGGASLQTSYEGITDSSTADGNGNYAVPVSGSLNEGDKVTVKSYINYLNVRKIDTVLGGALSFLNVPADLPFQDAMISSQNQVIERLDPNWTISVSDTRGEGSTWELRASIANPLTSTDGQDALPGALIFAIPGANAYVALNNTPTLIADGTTGPTPVTNISWVADQGLLVLLSGGTGRPDTQYRTIIEWNLVDAP